MAPAVLDVLLSGSVLLVDELEASLHPRLADQVLRHFSDPALNPRGAQIIFATHDTALIGHQLGEPRLRRDQIWLTEKRPDGSTCLPADRLQTPRRREPRAGLPSGPIRRRAVRLCAVRCGARGRRAMSGRGAGRKKPEARRAPMREPKERFLVLTEGGPATRARDRRGAGRAPASPRVLREAERAVERLSVDSALLQPLSDVQREAIVPPTTGAVRARPRSPVNPCQRHLRSREAGPPPELNSRRESSRLLDLLRDHYAGNSDNRDFIHAWTEGGKGGAALENYRVKVVEQFFSKKNGPGELRLGEARKAIRTYRKATGDLAGTVELLMTYVESGATLTHHYGDIDERFYRSVESVLNEVAALLRGEARSMYPGFSDRLARVEQMAAGIGWGFCDAVADVVGQLREQLGGQ